jgi:hypothetical protein
MKSHFTFAIICEDLVNICASLCISEKKDFNIPLHFGDSFFDLWNRHGIAKDPLDFGISDSSGDGILSILSIRAVHDTPISPHSQSEDKDPRHVHRHVKDNVTLLHTSLVECTANSSRHRLGVREVESLPCDGISLFNDKKMQLDLMNFRNYISSFVFIYTWLR